MSRLPQIGSDDGTWGSILNDFLQQAHDADGTLKSGSVTAASIANGVISEAKLDAGVQTKLNTVSGGVADGAVTTPKLADGAVTTVKLADGAVSAAKLIDGSVTGAKIPDASVAEAKLDSSVTAKLNAVGTVSDGAITTAKLADGAITDVKVNASAAIAQSKISGLTAALSGKEPTITAGTTAQYLRGDKSFQTLDKAAVGLTNVDNTSDANKPVSTATQAALDLKANASSIGPQFLVLSSTDTVPLGTAAGTVIIRTT